MKTILAHELGDRLRAGPVNLIDVRTPAEHRAVHVEGARLVPLGELDVARLVSTRPEAGPFYVLCQSGGRARKACEAFARAGHGDDAILVEGGTAACVEAGLPVVRGRASISIERQVRIAAGGLVLLGTVLGAFVHPAWLGLAGFIGAGLIFSGVTDTCGMAMALARMPWNQAGPAQPDRAVGAPAPATTSPEAGR